MAHCDALTIDHAHISVGIHLQQVSLVTRARQEGKIKTKDLPISTNLLTNKATREFSEEERSEKDLVDY